MENLSPGDVQRACNKKKCPRGCNIEFKTIRAAVDHVVASHPLVSQDEKGPVTLKTIALAPYGIRDRNIRFNTCVFFNGEEIPREITGWHVGSWAEGVEWASQNLMHSVKVPS
jgi:hypothetical protein